MVFECQPKLRPANTSQKPRIKVYKLPTIPLNSACQRNLTRSRGGVKFPTGGDGTMCLSPRAHFLHQSGGGQQIRCDSGADGTTTVHKSILWRL